MLPRLCGVSRYGPEREAVAGRVDQAVLDEHRRTEQQLQVGPGQLGARADEAAGLRDVAAERPVRPIRYCATVFSRLSAPK
jgi:hypothetical protein